MTVFEDVENGTKSRELNLPLNSLPLNLPVELYSARVGILKAAEILRGRSLYPAEVRDIFPNDFEKTMEAYKKSTEFPIQEHPYIESSIQENYEEYLRYRENNENVRVQADRSKVQDD